MTKSVRPLLLLAAAWLSSCSSPPAPPPTTVRIATGAENGVLNAVGGALAIAYTQKVSGLVATAQLGRGLEDNLDALERGEIDLAFDDSETTYVAYRKGTSSDPQPHSRIRAIGVLFPTVVHVFAREASGIERVTDFRGKRIDVGARGSDAELAARLILESYGLDEDRHVHAVFGSSDSAANDIRTGALDGVVYYVPFHHRLTMEVTTRADVRLIPIGHQQIASIQERSERSHFLKSTVVPRGTYRGQERDVVTIGEDILLLCRDDLPEPLVYELTRTLFDSTPDLVKAHPAAASIDPERGPTTSIPLHPGAARYYRERELPR